MSNEIEKTSEDLDLELRGFIRQIGDKIASSEMKNFLELEKISKEDVELTMSEIFSVIPTFDNHSQAAFEMIICDRIVKVLKARIARSEEFLLNSGAVRVMIGTTEFLVNVYSGGVKKEVSSQDLKWHFVERENSLVDGLKKAKKAPKNDE